MVIRAIAVTVVLAPVMAATVTHSLPEITNSNSSVSTASPTTCDGGFDAIPSPNAAATAQYLFAAAALAPNDVWAVGTNYPYPLTEHWNGLEWSIVPSPITRYQSRLLSVSAISTDDIWAVGEYTYSIPGDYVTKGFAEHWNGSSWTLDYSTPNPGGWNTLAGVAALSSSDVWAIGYFSDTSPSGLSFKPAALIDHWDGRSWGQVAAPPSGLYDSKLTAISAWSSSDMWAVGSGHVTSISSPHAAIAEHWNGAAWTVVPLPSLAGDNGIDGVTTLEPGHAVGVGFGPGTVSQAWDLRGSGSSTTTALPGAAELSAIARSGPALWSVGGKVAIPGTWNMATHTVTWGAPGRVAIPQPAETILWAVTAVSADSFWAVGNMAPPGGPSSTLAESFCAVHFGLGIPATVNAGAPFSLAVTALTPDGMTATAYGGTVHFTSTDGAAVLPGDYTFTPTDNGMHTFSGIVLKTPCQQTIDVTDFGMPLTVQGSATISVWLGPCQAPAGAPRSRGVNQSPAGTPVPRYPMGLPNRRAGARAVAGEQSAN